jgi:hypothetical protein
VPHEGKKYSYIDKQYPDSEIFRKQYTEYSEFFGNKKDQRDEKPLEIKGLRTDRLFLPIGI